ncbi:MAG: hypothetical protein A2V50_01850 [Bacteroidetes bacterium RBG_19FT_COMBO_42_10]|nr:MAG: hypothetical protein A2V50_01850 [Bacteroidetes bacterium RBG_19FT_COMBO_42_10]
MNLDFVIKGLVIRSWKFHLAVFIFSLIITIIYSVIKLDVIKPDGRIDLLILLFIQLELFFSVAFRIFGEIKTGTDRREITRTLLLKFVLFMAICFLISLIVNIIYILASSMIRELDPNASLTMFFEKSFKEWMKQTVGGLMFGAAVFIFIQWQDALKREQKLREENLIFQNETLKNQVNPHFLFNSLNTLSSLIASNPEAADRFIARLASMYRYILENSQKDKISLLAELDYIKNYYDLHKIRDEEKIILTIISPDSDKFEILPVSLQILIENAIKHNKATRESPLSIEVFIDGHYVVVRNNLQKMAMQLKSTGIGLRNLTERLKLITGKSLIVEETKEYFIAKVPLL